MTDTKMIPIQWDGVPVPPKRWYRDHLSTLLYIETCCVDGDGTVRPEHMRTKKDSPHSSLRGGAVANHRDYPTRLADAVQLEGHDDWDCAGDMVAAGYLEWNGTGLQPIFKLTDLGWSLVGQLRRCRAERRELSVDDASAADLLRTVDAVSQLADQLARRAREMDRIGNNLAIVKQLRDLLFSAYRRIDELQTNQRPVGPADKDLRPEGCKQGMQTCFSCPDHQCDDNSNDDPEVAVVRLARQLQREHGNSQRLRTEARLANERANERDARVVELCAELAELRAKLADAAFTPPLF